MEATKLLYNMGMTFIRTSVKVVDFLSNTYTVGNVQFSVLSLMFGIGITTVLALIIVKSVLF